MGTNKIHKINNFWLGLKKPITVLAPMDDITDYVFRENLSDIGKPDVLFTEFTNADALLSEGKEKVIGNLKFSEKQRPVVAQIWGSDPEKMGKVTRMIAEMGFDGIDINMGCPDKSVFSANAGSALIGNTSLASEIIESVKENSGTLPVSVKTRLAKTEGESDDWFNFLLKQKIQCLIVHARTRRQMYGGVADWGYIKRVVGFRDINDKGIIVIGNGDIKSYNEISQKVKDFGVDGVMVGRGVLHNPLLFINKEISNTLPDFGLGLLESHLDLFKATWGTTKNIANIKKHIKSYIQGFRGADDIRISLMACKTYEEMKEIITEMKVKFDSRNSSNLDLS